MKATNLKLENSSEHHQQQSHHQASPFNPNSSSGSDGMFSAVTNLARKLTPGGSSGSSDSLHIDDSGNRTNAGKQQQHQGQGGKYVWTQNIEFALRSLTIVNFNGKYFSPGI